MVVSPLVMVVAGVVLVLILKVSRVVELVLATLLDQIAELLMAIVVATMWGVTTRLHSLILSLGAQVAVVRVQQGLVQVL